MKDFDWDGKERRVNLDDHDLLIRIANDCEHMKEWTETHTKSDDTRFKTLNDNDKWQNKILYGFLGVFIFVEFIARLIK